MTAVDATPASLDTWLEQHGEGLIALRRNMHAHPELSGESRRGVSGNYGTLDQIATLKWVQRNIARFVPATKKACAAVATGVRSCRSSSAGSTATMISTPTV
mgnify:CR=1 FL=1